MTKIQLCDIEKRMKRIQVRSRSCRFMSSHALKKMMFPTNCGLQFAQNLDINNNKILERLYTNIIMRDMYYCFSVGRNFIRRNTSDDWYRYTYSWVSEKEMHIGEQ